MVISHVVQQYPGAAWEWRSYVMEKSLQQEYQEREEEMVSSL